MSNIPTELQFIILLHVRIRHLRECYCVCREWYYIIHDMSFHKKLVHHNPSYSQIGWYDIIGCNTICKVLTYRHGRSKDSIRFSIWSENVEENIKRLIKNRNVLT